MNPAWLLIWINVSMQAAPPAAGELVLLQRQGKLELLTSTPVSGQTIQMQVAEVLTLVVVIDHPSTLEVQIPATLTRTPAWREWQRSTPRPGARQLILVPLAPGNYLVQLEPWKIREPGGSWQTIQWQALPVRVEAGLKEGDLAKLRDISAIESVPELVEEPSRPWWWLGLGGLFLGLVLGGGYLAWARRGPSARPRPTIEAWAGPRLDRLAALNLATPKQIARGHGLLANLVRSYLVRRHQIPARRLTTPELTQAIEANPSMPAAEKQWVMPILVQCDQVRFACRPALVQEWQELIRQTRQVLTGRIGAEEKNQEKVLDMSD